MFLPEPPPSAAQADLYARDVAEDGYVSNNVRLWAWRPEVCNAFIDTRKLLVPHLSMRERAVLVCAAARAIDDSYCSLAWGHQLAKQVDATTAAALLTGDDPDSLTPREKALVAWARQVVRAPNAARREDVERLRGAGLTDQEIFDATVFIAFRLAFSTVNDALGARPDWQLALEVPREVREAVTYGRPVAERSGG
jgi:uncharacterized peroxidase-related enzyme